MALAAVASAAGTGALAGFGVGVLWAVLRLPSLTLATAAIAVGGAVTLDAVGSRWARARAPSLGRQVPQLWSTVFSPSTTAFLYGARLGVGPLTILPSWLWWVAVAVGAAGGPVTGAVAGAVFGATRLGLVVLASVVVEGSMARRMARLAAAGPGANAVVSGVALLVVSLVLAGSATGFFPAHATGSARQAAAAVREREVGSLVSPVPGDGRGGRPSARLEAIDDPLGRLLVGEVPGGLELLPDDRPGLGSVDLAEAAAVEDDPEAERALLETRRFERGFARAWEGAGGIVAYAMVYRFATAKGAGAYLTDGFITLEARGAGIYDVAEVQGARGFSQVDRRESGSVVAHGVAWVRHTDFFLLFTSGPGSMVTADDATDLAVAQAAHVAETGVAG